MGISAYRTGLPKISQDGALSPLSLNRETACIVEGLREEYQTPEDLLEVVTCVRGDWKDPTYIFTELCVGYRMPKGETGEEEM